MRIIKFVTHDPPKAIWQPCYCFFCFLFQPVQEDFTAYFTPTMLRSYEAMKRITITEAAPSHGGSSSAVAPGAIAGIVIGSVAGKSLVSTAHNCKKACIMP
jgi:hypothetical protein